MSTPQAAYMATSEAAMEAIWIRKLVGDLGVMPSINEPIDIYCDNSASIIFANDSGVMKGARHFIRRYHYVREQVKTSARRTLRGAQFVNKLVVEMEEAQLELKDNSGNTALCFAAINGLMPLCKAALSGRYDVVKYLFDKSDRLRGDGWDAKNHAWLLQKCVEGDMFDIALQILTEHIELANDEELLRILARKPDAFVKKSSNFLWKTVIWVFAFVCPKEGHPKKDTQALQLLKMIIKDMINRDDRLSNGNQEQQPHPPERIADYEKIEPQFLRI
ncbi:ankyrin repeat-containing domain, PGG domain protein [Tanacetum coccineum]